MNCIVRLSEVRGLGRTRHIFGKCTNPPRGVRSPLTWARRSFTTTCKSYTDLITASPTWRWTAFSGTVARYEQHKTFRILYPARG